MASGDESEACVCGGVLSIATARVSEFGGPRGKPKPQVRLDSPGVVGDVAVVARLALLPCGPGVYRLEPVMFYTAQQQRTGSVCRCMDMNPPREP